MQQSTTESEILSSSINVLRDHVRDGPNESYFLSPLLSFMRPTALQVLNIGGDCAYQGRALIVLLHQFGIPASKLAVFHDGSAIHAVVLVFSGAGEIVVDPLYHFIHRYPDGKPIPLEQLKDPAVFKQSLSWAAERGELKSASEYPETYYFTDVRTNDWNRNAILASAYSVLSRIFGKDKIDRLPRPYFLEEPALMTAVSAVGLSLLAALVCLRLKPKTSRRI